MFYEAVYWHNCLKDTNFSLHIVLFGKFHRIRGAPPETFPNVRYDATRLLRINPKNSLTLKLLEESMKLTNFLSSYKVIVVTLLVAEPPDANSTTNTHTHL